MASTPFEDEAAKKMGSGMTCSQAVFSIFADQYNIPSEVGLKLSAGFAGGVGLSGNVCGAACGGIMALGMAFAPTRPDNQQEKQQFFAKTQQFLTRFKKIHGTELCSEITGIADMTDPEAGKRIKEDQELKRRCMACVQGATAILVDMLPEQTG